MRLRRRATGVEWQDKPKPPAKKAKAGAAATSREGTRNVGSSVALS
jgi:hypothetical protein